MEEPAVEEPAVEEPAVEPAVEPVAIGSFDLFVPPVSFGFVGSTRVVKLK